ncbi:ribosomal ribonucleate guanine-2-methyltransferase [gamma proteobacterium HTCC5015]|nr:ribosomal ribonucleate guanine-2-methyltransferase [gamma proteobacterium HTCC5015]
MQTPFGHFELQRLPLRRRETLQAWDAADEYLLQHHAAQRRGDVSPLLLNDNFGALAINLARQQPVSWGDSATAHAATAYNLKLNALSEKSVLCVPSTQVPALQGVTDVLIRVPKNLALFEQQLRQLRPLLAAQAQVTAAGMVKHLPHGAKPLMEQILGPCQLSRAEKKARLIHCVAEQGGQHIEALPDRLCEVSEWDIQLSNQVNVFAHDKLDIGARFFLEQFHHLPAAQRIVDLGCGSGVLGIAAQKQQPHAAVTFIDESYMAVASAKKNYQINIGDGDSVRFIADHQLPACRGSAFKPTCRPEGRPTPTLPDLILCNPPFHQGNTISEHIARGMIQQSHQALAQGGELWLVFNRHLSYPSLLKRLFGGFETIAQNKKFIVTRAVKR